MIDALRGHLAEFGIIAAQGLGGIRALLARVERDDGLSDVPAVAWPALRTLTAGVRGLDHEIKRIETRLKASRAEDERVKRLMSIPGVGIISATAIAATVPDASLFRSGRDFAAWLGLVPRQHSSGGKTRLGRMSKMGDRYIRRLLIQGAISAIHWGKRKAGFAESWLGRLLARKPMRLVAVAHRQQDRARRLGALGARRDIQVRHGLSAGGKAEKAWKGEDGGDGARVERPDRASLRWDTARFSATS